MFLPLTPRISTLNFMSFYKEELANTLSEQSFGIASYSLGESSSDQANASVELLEKVLVNINVSARGFQATSINPLLGSVSLPPADLKTQGQSFSSENSHLIHNTIHGLLIYKYLFSSRLFFIIRCNLDNLGRP
ncbi:hypothetical protein PNOK_0722000 [Pyrrhoderma noxium]|uniref:Uncharacterized protein n=1 Tax=Pyrrhoderma noxium TaxID=2282107 RepID=A0A286UC70_9AGAM|nr:hypothetical protein PNOK_0722000 [Pyrrhoderma noxium]